MTLRCSLNCGSRCFSMEFVEDVPQAVVSKSPWHTLSNASFSNWYLQFLIYHLFNVTARWDQHIFHLQYVLLLSMITMLVWFASTCLWLDVEVPPDLGLVILDISALTYARELFVLFTVFVVATCIYLPIVRCLMVSRAFLHMLGSFVVL